MKSIVHGFTHYQNKTLYNKLLLLFWYKINGFVDVFALLYTEAIQSLIMHLR